MGNDLISVIVPVYNVEKYLKLCIDSILCQTYSNLEIILVDDGSSDRSPEICDRYAEQDLRIKVIHKKNEGLSATRNAAAKIAQGKYIAFIDSDDYITKDYIESLYSLICKYHAEIAVCRFVYVYGDKEDMVDGKVGEYVYNCTEALKTLFLENEFGHFSHQKLFLTEIVKKHPYPVGKIYEDVATTYLMFEETKTVAYTQCQLYYYRQRPGSIISQTNKTRFDIIEHIDTIQQNIQKQFPEILPYTEVLKVFYYLHTLARLPYGDRFQPIRSKINTYIRKNRWKFIRSDMISKRVKMQLLITLFGERIYKRVWLEKEKRRQRRIQNIRTGESR